MISRPFHNPYHGPEHVIMCANEAGIPQTAPNDGQPHVRLFQRDK